MGVCLYDFRDLPHLSDQPRYLASLIAACVAVGAGLVEINANCLEPPNTLPFAGIPRLWDAPSRAPSATVSTPCRPRSFTNNARPCATGG
jgi:hypothetical protein